MDAFDADVLIYAAAPTHPLGRRIRPLFADATDTVVGIGSVLLIPELFSKPTHDGNDDELAALAAIVSRLELRPVDEATAVLSAVLGATYSLRAVDAVHLATAVSAGADRFITNNTTDFPKAIPEVDITYPTDLPDTQP